MMVRLINFVFLGLMAAGAVVTYVMKHQAEEAAAMVERLQTKIDQEKESITELKAEWSLLTQPSRLQALVAKHTDYFKLQPFSADQIATLDELPQKPPIPGDDVIGKTLAAAGDGHGH